MSKPIINSDMVDNLKPYFKGVDDPPYAAYSTANISDPPTTAELNSAFDTASNLEDGFTGLVDDSGGGLNVWVVYVSGGAWFGNKLTVI